MKKPDVLILDEPTNHLDTVTAAALCEALAHFEGAIVAVSHDESFVNTLMNSTKMSSEVNGTKKNSSDATLIGSGINKGEIWIMSKRQLKRYDGSFAEYKKAIKRKIDSGVLEIE